MSRAAVQAREALVVSTTLTAKYFRALGDPTRLRILELLMEAPSTVTELVDALRLPQSRVSNHLACLRWCGFVESVAEGRWTRYSVASQKLRQVIRLGRVLVASHAERVAACTIIEQGTARDLR